MADHQCTNFCRSYFFALLVPASMDWSRRVKYQSQSCPLSLATAAMEDHEGQHIYVQIMKAELHVIYCFFSLFFFLLGNSMKTMSSYWLSVLDKLFRRKSMD